jgi:hypothetical protein
MTGRRRGGGGGFEETARRRKIAKEQEHIVERKSVKGTPTSWSNELQSLASSTGRLGPVEDAKLIRPSKIVASTSG